MARKAPSKCIKCAALHIDQVHQLHGSSKTDPQNFVRDPNIASGGCYDSKKCPQKRSYLRNTEVIRQKRLIEHQALQIERLPVEAADLDHAYAVLTVYREAGYDSPVHAVPSAKRSFPQAQSGGTTKRSLKSHRFTPRA